MCNNKVEQPNSAYGYIVQIPRGLSLLINNSGTVYLEKYDDLVVEDANGKIEIIEQVKDTQTSLSNNSIEFWKTISNWITLLKNNPEKFTPHTKFVFCVNAHKELKENYFITKCINAKDNISAKEAYKYLRDNFKSSNSTLKEMFKTFAEIQNEDFAVRVITNFVYNEPLIDIYTDTLAEIERNYSQVNDIEYLKNRILAWTIDKMCVKEKTEKTDKKKLKKEFKLVKEEFNSFIHKDKNLKLALKDELTSKDQQEIEKAYFVKQLNLIELDQHLIKRLDIRDFLRWRNTYEKECKRGCVTKDDFQNTYKQIFEKWLSDKNYLFRINKEKTDTDKGYMLYNNTIQQEVKVANLPFEDQKEDVARGVCNFLANNNEETKDYTIGWHPNFENELGKDASNE